MVVTLVSLGVISEIFNSEFLLLYSCRGNKHNVSLQIFHSPKTLSYAPGVNISPNFQGWQPSGPGKPFVSSFFLSLDLKL